MLLLPAPFLDTLTQQIESAQQSVYLQSLTLEVGKVMGQLTPALIRAAKRGVHVELRIDWIAQNYVHGKVSLTPRIGPAERKYAAELHRKNRQLSNTLIEGGVKIVFVNRPNWLAKVLPVAGRNHIKLYMVDEKIVWIGGVNLLDLTLEHLDFMMSFGDQILIRELKEVFFADKVLDKVVPYAPNSTLVVDGGRRGFSPIYQTALEMVESATSSIVLVSQFVPEGKLLKLLVKKARQGCSVTVLSSPKSLMQFSRWPYKLTYLRCQRVLRTVGLSVTHLPQKVHCKLLLVDESQAIFGSHNLVETGIGLGTAEIAIKTSDPILLSELVSFVSVFHTI